MPYEWTNSDNAEAELVLWPFRSLPRRGFVWFIGGTAALISIPLLAVLGTAMLWGLLPFLAATLAGIWRALSRSYRDGRLIEVLSLSLDRISLVRRAPDGTEQRWQANPYWVRLRIYPTGGPVPDYLTLKGGGREVEIGAFLTPSERRQLAGDLARHLAQRRN